MATSKKKTNEEPAQPEAIESYRARALSDITVVPGFVIAAGDVFETDQIPFDPKTMERVS